MKSIAISLLAGTFLTVSLPAREALPLDTGWDFHQGTAEGAGAVDFDSSGWEKVDVPHDWSIAGEFKEDAPCGGAGGWLPTGVAWYRKTIELEEKPELAWLEFDGVMAHSEIWLNGEKVGGWPYGYTRFRCDVSDAFRAGENLLAVRTDTSAQPASRWYAGSGIYRHARLILADELHVAPDGVFITTPEVSRDRAQLEVKVELSSPDASVRLRATSPDGKAVAETTGKAGTLKLEIQSPQLWSIDTPALYQLTTEVLRGEEVVDSVTTSFGIRRAEFRADTGFWLNDENLKIKGVCLHHDGGAVGSAVPLDVWERRLSILRSLGVNGIRTAHNPVDPGFLSLCDRMGFVVMNEAFDCWTKGKNTHDYHRHFTEWWEHDLRSMVRRDRNHPSVVLYSVGNEIRDTHDTDHAKKILTDLVRVCHEEDPTRPVTQALFRPNVTKDYDNGLADLLDVIGTNYRDTELLDAWKDDPTRKIIGTEQGHERSTWFHCRDHPQHAGQFLWCGIDYLGESRTWPVTTFNAGLLDRTGWVQPRGWERASWWSEKPVVKAFRRVAATEATPPDPGYEVVEWKRRQVLFPDWNPEKEGEQNVEVYTNAEEAELFLNNRSLGTKRVKKDIAVSWKVPFEPGTLKVVARSGGKEVASDELRTAGEPAKLAISSDRETLPIGYEKVAHLELRVVDENGVVCPRASDKVSFDIEGPAEIIGIDNGSITSHESFVASERSAFQGRVLAIVRATGEGAVKITASAEGLEPSTLEFSAGR